MWNELLVVRCLLLKSISLLVRSQKFPQTFSNIRTTALDDFDTAKKDDEIRRTFFAIHNRVNTTSCFH